MVLFHSQRARLAHMQARCGSPRLWLIALAATAAMLVGFTRPGHVMIGDHVPNVALPQLNGKELHLADLRGKVAVVAFYSPVCEPCHRMLPVLVDLVHRVSLDKKVPIPLVVIVLDGEPEKAAVAHYGRAIHWLIDRAGEADSQFDPEVRPCTYLVDKGGIVRHIDRGYGSGYGARVERWLRGMLEAP